MTESPEYLVPRVRIDGPIVLVDYDPTWPGKFASRAEQVRRALGPIAVTVEHVGSTSVPGLTAKPIIDIVLTVPDAADESAYVPALVGEGFVLRLREPGWHQHRLLGHTVPETNLHVFTVGAVESARMLAFRDRLRNSSEDRETYAREKQVLAQRNWQWVQDYADAKSTVVERILA